MLVELRKQLEPVGKVDLLATVAAEAHAHRQTVAARDPSNADWQTIAGELRETVATCCKPAW